MHYLDQKLKQVAEMFDNLQAEDGGNAIYDDIFSGSEFQELAEHIKITGDDTIVSLSLDGAQLYQNKKSDTWISIWILDNLSPHQRYQKQCVLPGTIIPGPNKPKIIDSYLYCGLHHLSALQCENNGAGLRMWDTATSRIIQSQIILALSTADAVGITELDGCIVLRSWALPPIFSHFLPFISVLSVTHSPLVPSHAAQTATESPDKSPDGSPDHSAVRYHMPSLHSPQHSAASPFNLLWIASSLPCHDEPPAHDGAILRTASS